MPSTLDERYRYDAHGHRIQVTAGAGTRFPVYTRDGLLRAEYGVENDTYYYLGTQLVARKRSGLRPDLIFLSGFEALLPRALAKRLVEALVGLKSGGESVTWFLTDHLGSNIATVDAAGAVIERSQFAPYGERWGKVAERGPGFTGHYEDQSTLTYMKARYYGGIVGRFLSPDPVLTDTADGGNFNRYWYANNNPINNIDPDGRAAMFAPYVVQGAMHGARMAAAKCGSSPTCQRVVIGTTSATIAAATDPLVDYVRGAIADSWTNGTIVNNESVSDQPSSPSIDPADVAGKTPDEIDRLAGEKGLDAKGSDPKAGKGSYTDPVTGKQRILVHPDADCGPHCHVNNPQGERLDINGQVVPPESPDAHLPLEVK